MTKPREPMEGGSPGRVLCVRLGAIGDVTNALVLAAAIKDACPGAHVGWAVHPMSAPLVHDNPCVDAVHVVERTLRPGKIRGLVGTLRRERYDVALDLQRLQKSALLARLSGASRVIGFDRARSKEGSWLWTKERIEPGPRTEHMVHQYLRFARCLDLGEVAPRHPLPRKLESAKFADEFVRSHGRPVLLSVGASKPEKTWPSESFLELARQFERAGIGPLVCVGGPGDVDAANDASAGTEALNLAGKTSLFDLIELCARSRLMVTGDTGPMHLCAAVGTPVVAIFGPGTPARTGPFGGNHLVIRDDRIVPAEELAESQPAPVWNTSVGTVIKAALANLKER